MRTGTTIQPDVRYKGQAQAFVGGCYLWRGARAWAEQGGWLQLSAGYKHTCENADRVEGI